MANFRARGAQLIDELKNHIEAVVRANPRADGFSLQGLEEASGLIILGKTGQNVWDMGVATLVIELVKEGRLQSSVPVGQLNTKSAAFARFSASLKP